MRKRTSSLTRKTPLRPTQWGVGSKLPKPLPKINVERRARVKQQRDAAKRSAPHKQVMREALLRANGVCECGCGVAFDKTFGQYAPDYPEFHHTKYDPPRGVYLRRVCHHRIEHEKHPTRVHRK